MLPVIRRNGWMNPTFEPFSQLRSEMDTLFDRVLGGDGSTQTPWAGVPMAIWEDEDHYTIEAELPGFRAEDVDVTVHNGTLYLRGDRRPDEGRKYLYNNRTYGTFQRAFTLPTQVNAEAVRAELVDGILTVTLQKSAESKPRKITLQTRGEAKNV